MGFVVIMQRIVDWIAANKLVTFLGVALFAFVVATIALAVENNDNAAALQSCQDRLYVATNPTTTVPPAVTTTLAPTTTPEPASTTTVEPSPEGNTGRKRRAAAGASSWQREG